MNFSGISNTNSIGKALRFPLRMIPNGVQLPILQGPLRGRKWIAGSSNHGCWLGSYEYEKQMAVSQAIQRGHVFYDLGANVGFYSLLASSKVGSHGHVFSFEPLTSNVRFLRRHLELNDVSNCTVIEAAVSSSNDVATFGLGNSRMEGSLAGADSLAGVKVRTVTLDALVASGELRPPNVIKCDIEGAEYHALVGAAATLSAYSPTIFLATHGRQVHEQCCKLLNELRYEMASLDGRPLSATDEIVATRRR